MTDEGRDWFVSVSGRRVFIRHPIPEDLHIDDIAHALSLVCRFGGHCCRFYSVAQHSVMVSRLAKPEYALAGLLHDASEAYLGDIIRPIKLLLPEYQEIEGRWEVVIAERFGLHWDRDTVLDVKRADRIALVTERRDLIAPHEWQWTEDELGFLPDPDPVAPLEPTEARRAFLARFDELTDRRWPS